MTTSRVSDLPREVTDIVESVLLEVAVKLQAYFDHIALVGGWVPYFLLGRYGRPGSAEEHSRSADIDLLITSEVTGTQEETLGEALAEIGFVRKPDPNGGVTPFMFVREDIDPVTQKPYKVQLDILGPKYGGTPPSRKSQDVQDIKALKVPGADFAADHTWECRLSGRLPNGDEAVARLRVADVVAFLVLKGRVLPLRQSAKDNYDIYTVLRDYGKGPEDVAAEAMPYADHGSVREAIINIAVAFRSRTASGPLAVADFLQASDEERDNILTDAYFVVRDFLHALSTQATWVAEHLLAD